MLKYLIYPAFVCFAVLSTVSGTSVVGFLLTVTCLGILLYFKNPSPNVSNAAEVLQSQKCSIIAHRCCAHDAPENTVIAIYEAHKRGVDAIEFDMEFTSDGVPVLMHDDTVDRTTDGTGEIGGMTYESVLKLNAAAKFSQCEKFSDARVPRLEEVVETCLKLGLKMYIDVKSKPKLAADTLVRLFEKYPEMYKNAIVCSFNPLLVYLEMLATYLFLHEMCLLDIKVRHKNGRIVGGLTHESGFLQNKVNGVEKTGPLYKQLIYPIADIILEWSIHSWLWYFCGSSAFLMSTQNVSLQSVEYFNKRGIQVIVWTPNNTHDKEYVTKTLRCSYITDTVKN